MNTRNRPENYGDLIAFEGLDGAGKASLAAAVAAAYVRAGRPAEVIAFPQSDPPTGLLLGGHLRGNWSTVDAACLCPDLHREMLIRQVLMTVDRYAQVRRIKGLLRRGVTVVLDRWYGSSYAYGVAEGLDPIWLLEISLCLPVPTAWFLLDLDPLVGRARRPGPPRDLNEGDMEKLARARDAYHEFFRAGAEEAEMNAAAPPFVVVDAARPLPDVIADVCARLRGLRPAG